jgi:hypothetical protein
MVESHSIPPGLVSEDIAVVAVVGVVLSPTCFASSSTTALVVVVGAAPLLLLSINDRAHIRSTRIFRCCNGGIGHPSRSCISIIVA